MIKLANVAQVLSGASPRKGGETTVSFVQIKDLRDSGGALFKGGAPSARRATPIRATDILVPSRGEGIAAFRPLPNMIRAFAGLDVYLVRPVTEFVDSDFLVVALNDERAIQQLKAAATGGALPRIPKRALEDVQVPLPPRDVQRTIARLGALVRQYETLQNRRSAAETKLNTALLSHILHAST